ncbi:pathogenesis associated protein Cap20 [Arthroderma uncinatum]|uniref:pathogenesis associated protein Cap20 n=1 Tax=Arthroderma uncinatum TaxID=74035 RepID=UPI00144AF6C8|nr:pathogenesis associated protein Cap20 [Arthroderma uncinatum]KAF3491485.1 pathogenesis associated protein Cap20 [Arthroderma uncinatum]
MGEPTANGTRPTSQFLSHLISYPIVSDSLTTLKKSPYAQKPLEYADKSYSQLEPIFPYLAKPYGFVAPYVEKVDHLGNEGLNTVDSTYPKLVKATEDVRGTVRSYIRVAEDGTKYVRSTYDSECKLAQGGPVVLHGKAAVSTGLMVTSQYLLWLSNILVPHKEKAQENGNGAAKANDAN